jgi:hypothetical protein
MPFEPMMHRGFFPRHVMVTNRRYRIWIAYELDHIALITGTSPPTRNSPTADAPQSALIALPFSVWHHNVRTDAAVSQPTCMTHFWTIRRERDNTSIAYRLVRLDSRCVAIEFAPKPTL